MNDEIKQAAEKYKREMWGDHGLVPSDALIKAFETGANYANEKCQEWIKELTIKLGESHDRNAKQEEEIKRLKEEMRLLHLNSRSNYISKDQAELVKQIRIKYGLN